MWRAKSAHTGRSGIGQSSWRRRASTTSGHSWAPCRRGSSRFPFRYPTAPSVVLTTSSAAEDVGDYVDQSRMDTAPKMVEIDTLNLDAQGGPSLQTAELPSIAYLQYSSGSTRLPTGVMMSHRNVTVNFEQLMASFFANSKIPPNSTLVSWLPFYHDMGLVLGVCAPILGGYHAQLTSQ